MENAVKDMNTTVMDMHNVTMAQYGEIMKLTDALKKKAMDTSIANLVEVDSVRTELDAINESMMDWMTSYEEPESNDSTAIKYLQEQLQFLTKLKSDQLQQMDAAKQILQ